ncbi:glutaconate CoA-transferase subunit B [Faunimonas pinastri]|uniref:Glutaconate CoA-transferase subunit B n=1 Tax=Faunimonas pinastri TaxID=1855383 RepID=A0A1H9EK15_9HYPH|nr:CoA-transferase [Faunimonas pinastri]SEQ26021.1 glutaconate CoA-transferase subunit B [Faunimonas pinastri]
MRELDPRREISPDERMAVAAAREIHDGDVAFIGTGLPMVAAYLAKATHAPGVRLVFESGIVDPEPRELAMGVGDYKLAHGSTKIAGTAYALSLLQGGRVDIGFLGTAEIDAFGNLNSTVIGAYRKPRVRLPGSGGANDIASMAKRFVTICRMDRRRFVEKLQYLTTPGFLTGPGAREAAGLPGAGPVRVITDLAILGFDPETNRLRVEELYPGISLDAVRAQCGFDLGEAGSIGEAPVPTPGQLHLLRDVIDPEGIYIGPKRA